jgi:N-acyl-D-amino-acid deacylase
MSPCHKVLTILAASALVAFVWLTGGAEWSAAQPREDWPMTGHVLPGLEHFDRVMRETMREHRLPGASLTISVKGKLVLSRGYGFAELANREPVHPHTLFNIASCTKAFTGAAACRLFDEGRLDLDAKVFRMLPHLLPQRGGVDPRAHQITVRQLLHHSAGFIHENVGGDASKSIADLVRERMSRPLDYDPGSRSHYSNLSFLLLRLVIHHASGEPYERYVEQQILRPIGVTDMRIDIERGYLPNEARRYHAANHKLIEGGHGRMRGGGCWLSSSFDMVRFLAALDGSGGKRLLSEKAMREMLAAPPPPYEARKNGTHFGLGWDVIRQTPEGVAYNKDGGVPGIQTFMQHLPGDVDWALCFNASGQVENRESGLDESRPAREPILKAIREQKQWPDGDLHGRIGPNR